MAPVDRRRPWVRRAVLSLLALLVVGGAALIIYVRSRQPDRYLRERMVEAVTRVLGRPASIERVSLRYLPPGVAIDGFHAEGPLLEASRVEATISLRSLLRGRIAIGDLDLYRPLLRWDVDTEKFLAERPPGERREGRLASRLSLRRFRIHQGEVIVGSRIRSFTAELEGLSVNADNASGLAGLAGLKGPWAGTANFSRARFSLGDLAADGLAGSVSFEADPENLRARRLRLKAQGVEVRGGGTVRPGAPLSGRFDLDLALDPESPALSRPLRQFSARQVSADVRITLSAEGARASGTFVADAPTIDLDRDEGGDGPEPPWRASRGQGAFTVDVARIEVSGALESFAGGEVRGAYLGVLDPGEGGGRRGPRRHQVTITAGGLRLEELLAHYDLPGDDRVAPSAAVSGRASLSWTAGAIGTALGTADLTFAPEPGALAISGLASLSWSGRRVTVESSSLEAPGSRLEMEGMVDASAPDLAFDLSGHLSSDDLSALRSLVENRFGPVPGDPGGRIDARLHVGGTRSRPEVRAEFDSTGMTASVPALAGGGGARRSVPLVLSAAKGRLHYRSDLLRMGLERAEGEGLSAAVSLSALPARGEIVDLDLEAASIPASLLAALAGLEPGTLSASGAARVTASLSAAAGGPAGRLAGPITLGAEQVRLRGLTLTGLSGRATLEAGGLRLEEAEVGLLGGGVRASGQVLLASGASGLAAGAIEVKATGIDLASIDAAFAGPSLAGQLDAAGRVVLGSPGSVEATFAGRSVRIAGLDLGLVAGSLNGPPDRLRLDLKDEAGTFTASGAVSTSAGLAGAHVDATVTVSKFSLEEVRPLLPAGSLAGLKGDVDGTIGVRGPLLQPSELEVQALLDRISLVAGDYPLHNEGPVRLTVRDGFLTLAPTRLAGEKTDLTFGGSVQLGGTHDVTARAQGTYDLGLVEILLPSLRASGPGTVDLSVVQRGDALTYEGAVTLEGGTLTHPALPLPLEGVSGRGRFTERGEFAIEELKFDMGGGRALGQGWARFEGASMPQMHLALSGAGIRAEIVPDLRAFFDADVTLDKDADGYRFGGRVSIIRAIYSRALGVEASELLLRGREFAPKRERRAGTPELFLDLDIVAEGDVWIRNQDALIEATANLSLQGTLDEPELSGRISALEGGSYRFRDVTYRIVGGALDFADISRIDPLIDIEAVTRVQQYEITLRVSGRFSRPIYELTSDPTLPQRDIVWLLITGRTLAESPTDATRGLAEGQVASYLAAPVAGAVSAPLEKFLGGSTVQIDPFFLNGTADPTARVTVTKRVASDLLFTYSSSLGQSGQEVYQVEYNPGRIWDLLGTRDLDGSMGADVRFRRRWEGLTSSPADLPQDQGATGTGNGGAQEPARVGRISIAADRLVDSQEALIRRLPFGENDPFRRGDLLEGREKLRQRYVERGYPAAEVDMVEEEPDPAAPGRRNVGYVIRAGPRHELKIGGEVRKRPIRRAVRDAWQEPILLEDLVEEARKAALDYLKGKGFHAARVEAAMEAPEPDRRVVDLQVEPGRRVRVRSIEISGNAGMPEERIRRQMLTREDTLINVLHRGLLREKVLEDDLAAIRSLYRANGYLTARVAPPAVTLSPDARQADIRLSIQEGPQSRIDTIAIEGEAEGAPAEELLKAVGLSRAQVVNVEAIEQAADRLREELDREGYSRARVGYRLEGPPDLTRVVFSITPLERVRVEEVVVEGNTRTHDRIVSREIAIDEGDYLSRTAILTTQRNLYRLGVFRSVEIESEPVEGKAGAATVRIKLREGSPILTAWGVGYDTEDNARASFELANNNLFGTRRSAALFLRGSAVDRRVQMTLRDPNLFGERIETVLGGFLERQEFESFDLRRLGVTGQLSRKVGETVTLFGRYRLEDIDLINLEVSEEETGQQTVRLGSAAASLAWDTRDDIINPTRGGLSSFDARMYHQGLGSEEGFLRFFGSASYFNEIGRGVVLASAVRAGLLISRNIPISERFFAGGDTTLRGFEFNTVGPQDPNTGKPVGGNGLFLINQELRFPIFRALKGVVFYDAGNVFPRFTDYDLGDLRHVGGLGLRLDTPLGPFRIEYGRKLDHELVFRPDDPATLIDESGFVRKRESSGEFFFSIGQAF